MLGDIKRMDSAKVSSAAVEAGKLTNQLDRILYGAKGQEIIRPSVVFLPLIELVLNRFEVAFCRCKFLPAQVIPVIYDLFPCGNEITIKKL